jgi:pseudouridine-5'-monophosphatase
LEQGEEKVRPEECLVFEDSIAGVEAGRRAGMRIVWVPHEGLARVCEGRELLVLEGRTEEGGVVVDLFQKVEGSRGEGERVKTDDGWAVMLRSLEGFPYQDYGIHIDQ